jgi:putative acetyltransferase
MGQALPKPGLRPLLAEDVPALAAIFRASIDELTADDYNEAQREAWGQAADDEQEFGARLAGQLTLIGMLGGSTVGFASLKDGSQLDMLYVHPAAASSGVGSALCDALEKLAAARGATGLTVDASDTARDFFTKRGYTAERRNMARCGDEWLGNTTMQKRLAGAETGKPEQ